MEHAAEGYAALVVSLSLVVGMVAQSVARHLRLPGIVLLLAAGVLLGPDFTNIIRPETLGTGLQLLVGFAVSIILFEGGLNLNLKRLREQAGAIQRLISVGAVVTAVGGGLAAWAFMGWDWRLAASFGVLVIVTGPTVITPLLRRIKVTHRVETVLEAEGVLIDSVGAILAVVTLEVVLTPSGNSVAEGLLHLFSRLGFGLLCGLAGGSLIALLLRYRKVVPEGLENVFTLSFVVALFQISNFFMPESGIVSVTAAGMVVGNVRTRVQRELMEFKEQLTVLLIGMLFVLLAADVRIADVLVLGWAGALTVACLMVVVRPLNVLVSTYHSELSTREKLFLSWVAPRGVVAAAVASLFAQKFDASGIPGGDQLRALVFTVIAGTVLVQGLSGSLVAGWLGVRSTRHEGYVIFGANPLAHALGRLIRAKGKKVVFIDRDPAHIQATSKDGFRVVWGNAIEERTLLRARVEESEACVAVTTSEDVNLLFARAVTEDFKVTRSFVACRKDRRGVTLEVLRNADSQMLFGKARDLDLWVLRFRRGFVAIETWRLGKPPAEQPPEGEGFDFLENVLLPLAVTRGTGTMLVSNTYRFKKDDEMHFAIFTEQYELGTSWLEERNWTRVGVVPLDDEEAATERGSVAPDTGP